MLPYSKKLKAPARTLRKDMTDAELVLWSLLRRKQILGIQYYRQKPIGPYIVDFYAPAVKLVIEADGKQHLDDEHREYDAVRDAFLNENGLMVLRFNNRQVLTETRAVMEVIFQVCEERLSRPFDKESPGDCQQRTKANPPESPFSKGGLETP